MIDRPSGAWLPEEMAAACSPKRLSNGQANIPLARYCVSAVATHPTTSMLGRKVRPPSPDIAKRIDALSWGDHAIPTIPRRLTAKAGGENLGGPESWLQPEFAS